MKKVQKYLLLQIAFILAFLVSAPKVLFTLSNNLQNSFNSLTIQEFIIQLVFGFVLTYLLLYFNYYKLITGWQKILFSVFIYLFCTYFFIKIHVIIFNLPDSRSGLRLGYHFRGIFLLFMAIFIVYYLKFTKQKQDLLLLNKSLETENLKAQLTSLQQQLNPHFLFNSLNSLQSLMREDLTKSQLFSQNLSTVLRYSLDFQNKATIPVWEELKLLDAYFYLLKIRFGHKLNLKLQNLEKVQGSLPPLALQLLIENAVNHNEISTLKPLNIWIDFYSETNTIKVKNNINSKRQPSNGSGLGLLNLKNRYELLGKKSIEIMQNENEFLVVIPIL